MFVGLSLILAIVGITIFCIAAMSSATLLLRPAALNRGAVVSGLAHDRVISQCLQPVVWLSISTARNFEDISC